MGGPRKVCALRIAVLSLNELVALNLFRGLASEHSKAVELLPLNILFRFWTAMQACCLFNGGAALSGTVGGLGAFILYCRRRTSSEPPEQSFFILVSFKASRLCRYQRRQRQWDNYL